MIHLLSGVLNTFTTNCKVPFCDVIFFSTVDVPTLTVDTVTLALLPKVSVYGVEEVYAGLATTFDISLYTPDLTSSLSCSVA